MVGEKAGKVNLSEVLKVKGCGASFFRQEGVIEKPFEQRSNKIECLKNQCGDS